MRLTIVTRMMNMMGSRHIKTAPAGPLQHKQAQQMAGHHSACAQITSNLHCHTKLDV
jgi:hypothetical protein